MSNETRPVMRRRTFLALGAVPVVLPLRLDAAAPLAGIDSGAGRAPAPMPVGYWRGSDTLPALASLSPGEDASGRYLDLAFDGDLPERGLEPPQVVAAESLAHGDATLAVRGASVRVHGLVAPGGGGATRFDAASLSCDLGLACEGTGPARHWALWVYDSAPVRNLSPPMGFTLPPGLPFGLALHADTRSGPPPGERAAPGRRRESSARFTAGAAPGRPRLRRGIYFLALPDRGRRPLLGWGGCRWQAVQREEGEESDGPVRRLRLARAGGGCASDESWLVLSVDAAGEEPPA